MPPPPIFWAPGTGSTERVFLTDWWCGFVFCLHPVDGALQCGSMNQGLGTSDSGDPEPEIPIGKDTSQGKCQTTLLVSLSGRGGKQYTSNQPPLFF